MRLSRGVRVQRLAPSLTLALAVGCNAGLGARDVIGSTGKRVENASISPNEIGIGKNL